MTSYDVLYLVTMTRSVWFTIGGPLHTNLVSRTVSDILSFIHLGAWSWPFGGHVTS